VRRGEPADAPVVVELDVTTFCDLACPECISGGLLNNGRFSDHKLLTLAAEMAEAGVKAVILIGGGEPLLHPAVGRVMEILAQRDVAIGLTTNGTQIHRYLEQIADCVLWTRVSVDAASPEIYNLFRPRRGGTRDAFSAVIANIQALADAKQGILGYSFLLMARRDAATSRILHHNFGDVANAARLARDLGCDYIEFKPEYDLGHHLVAQPEELRVSLRGELSEAVALQTDSFHVIAPPHLSRVLLGEPLDQPKSYRSCPTTELRTLLTPSGAYLCPYHRGNPSARYGDPAELGFRALWDSPERRRASRRIDPSNDCGFNCIRHESNEWLLVDDDPIAVVDDYDSFI
jgi:sulfatase maturation enzyme AslB (radical SAM superfamily)